MYVYVVYAYLLMYMYMSVCVRDSTMHHEYTTQ